MYYMGCYFQEDRECRLCHDDKDNNPFSARDSEGGKRERMGDISHAAGSE